MIKLLDLLENIKPPYTIFCDMDGVLVDFDKGYKELTGKSTKHQTNQNKDEFWDIFRESLTSKGTTEKHFWENLDWMSDGKQLWDYISQYNPYILTAPAVNHDLPADIRYKLEHNESKQGKLEWVKRLPNMKKIYFKGSNFKQDLAGPNKILIDDRPQIIEKWNEKGGIGILHTSSKNTIKELQKLGL